MTIDIHRNDARIGSYADGQARSWPAGAARGRYSVGQERDPDHVDRARGSFAEGQRLSSTATGPVGRFSTGLEGNWTRRGQTRVRMHLAMHR
jgi:hypothetical protein